MIYSHFPRIFVFIGLALLSCASDQPRNTKTVTEASVWAPPYSDKFGEYWYQGKGEITSYDLKQSRYGEIHDGTAVLVFVTEDFSKSKQVKLDYPGRNPDDKVSVMKVNFTKKFYTGVYPYSTMHSAFTPISADKYPYTLKVTSSSQEWCGHTFMQMNLQEDDYRVQLHSYFESEGEQDYTIEKAILEDEIWNRIRLSPDKLPTGKVKIIPGTIISRFAHSEFKPNEAEVSLRPSEENEDWHTYSITYEKSQRTLDIHFHKRFPHEIMGWDESYPVRWSGQPQVLTTTARKKASIFTNYWSKNNLADSVYRKQLGL